MINVKTISSREVVYFIPTLYQPVSLNSRNILGISYCSIESILRYLISVTENKRYLNAKNTSSLVKCLLVSTISFSGHIIILDCQCKSR